MSRMSDIDVCIKEYAGMDEVLALRIEEDLRRYWRGDCLFGEMCSEAQYVMEEYETDMIEQSRATTEIMKDMNVSDDNELILNMEE